ncbi:beta-lactamase/transpeptidase-like protein [Aspergillus heterothallicus]
MATLSSEFKDTLAESTALGQNKVPGCILAAVDRDGKYIALESPGSTTLSPPSAPIDPNSTFWMASCGKLIGAIAALQCIERGQISLDDPVAPLLPELANPEVFTNPKGEDLTTVPATTPITLRHLLTHTSGLAYDFFEPKLHVWRASRGETPLSMGGDVVKAHSVPLLFQPGKGFVYGGGIDWAAELIARLNNTTLEAYLQQHIFAPLTMTSTTFRLREHPEIESRLYPMFARSEQDGTLTPGQIPWPADASADCSGAGLYSSVPDYTKLLADIISASPKLLRRETLDEYIFGPQLAPGSEAHAALAGSSRLISAMTGTSESASAGVRGESVNWSLGGMFFNEDVEHIRAGTVSWGGLPNVTWAANRKRGVATLYATQVLPYNDGDSAGLARGFVKEIWRVVEEREKEKA